jgi:hypothetical protein
MAYSRFQFFPYVWSDEIQHNQKGILDTAALKEKINSAGVTLYEIPLAYRYRPDLIALKIYGSGHLHWILTYINDINDSPEGYYTNRVIKIPSPKRILELV